jgi:hypothetical protein
MRRFVKLFAKANFPFKAKNLEVLSYPTLLLFRKRVIFLKFPGFAHLSWQESNANEEDYRTQME